MSKQKNKHNPEQVLDTFHASGTDAFALAKVIDYMTANTRVFRLHGPAVSLHCIVPNGNTMVLKECPANPHISGSGAFVALDSLWKRGGPAAHWSKEQQEEAMKSGIFISFCDDMGNRIFASATSRLSADFALFGINGLAAQNPSYHLLGLVKEQMENTDITLVARVDQNDAMKFITMRSKGYAYFPQTDALEIASNVCNDGVIQYWDVTNFFTEVVYAFPQYAVSGKYGKKNGNITPHIRYMTSDAGDSSLSFVLGWEVNGRSIFLASGTNRVSRRHSGEMDDALKAQLEMSAKKLKDKFTILPDRLAELHTMVIDNKDIEAVAHNFCSDAKITNKGTQMILVRRVLDEFGPADATAAEIVLTLIEAQSDPELLNLSDNQRKVLAQCLGEVPYCRPRKTI